MGGVYCDALILAWVESESQVQDLESTLEQYSNSKLNNLNTVTVTVKETFKNLSDVIPVDDYMPFYVNRYRHLGYKRFVELANKARAGKDPKRLFFWMLKNNEIVK